MIFSNEPRSIAYPLLYVMLLYFVFSFTEWFVHRYFMHAPKSVSLLSNDHWTHHEHTQDDMCLTQDDDYHKDKNKYLGLFFIWPYTVVVFTVGLLEAACLNLLLQQFHMGVPWWFVVLWVLLFGFYQSSFWNTIHPDIHDVATQLTWSEGVPGWDGWKTGFHAIGLYDWMKQNHVMHHLRKQEQKGNFNVTLPGADFLTGTLYTSL